MKFVDRTQEKERLTKILNMDKPTFTAIYGRRRLGKSALITRVITDNDIYYLADESEASAQRILLSKLLLRNLPVLIKLHILTGKLCSEVSITEQKRNSLWFWMSYLIW